jgi:formylglycine-generating enzyme required for sulfatase activity
MAGNVAEWTASWFNATEAQRVYRGGSFASGELELRVGERTPLEPASLNGGTGARCVSDL